MANIIRRILARIFNKEEEIRYIDFVNPPIKSQYTSDIRKYSADQQNELKGDSSQNGTARDLFPPTPIAAGNSLHPDDDWFPLTFGAISSTEMGSGQRTPKAERGAAWERDETGDEQPQEASVRGNLDPELNALLESSESPETDNGLRTAAADVDENTPTYHDEEWLFEDVIPDFDAPSENADTTPAAWIGDDPTLVLPPTLTPVEIELEDNVAWRAGSRAAALLDGLDIPHSGQRRQALRCLEKLLQEFPHSSSHAAIARLVFSGLSIAVVEEVASIIRMWREESSFWLCRRFDRLESRWVVRVDYYRGRNAFTWKQAAALVMRVDAAEAMMLLHDEWRDQWFQLEPDDYGSSSYADFVSIQIMQLASYDLRPTIFAIE